MFGFGSIFGFGSKKVTWEYFEVWVTDMEYQEGMKRVDHMGKIGWECYAVTREKGLTDDALLSHDAVYGRRYFLKKKVLVDEW